MSISAFDHPFLSGLVGDDDVAALLADDAEIAAMVAFESALAAAEAEYGVIPFEAARTIVNALRGFVPDLAGLKDGTKRDGVVVPELVRQMREAVGQPHAPRLHFGATSQDAIDTSLVLRLVPILSLLERRIDEIDKQFETLTAAFGHNALMAMTRMQAALPITVGDRIASWRNPLVRHKARLAELRPMLLVVQFGGASGTLEKLGDRAEAVRRALAERIGLGDGSQWHSQRDRIAELAGWLSLVTGSLGKFGQDIALMAQAGNEIVLATGGGSSAMPHKQNPIGAEILVTLARFNATQLAAIHQSLIHEQERSGAAWTLEWLVLPQMIMATAAATRIAFELTGSIEAIGS
jgi:3-carboxy-cis,cis-muconate cycloisomerase